MNKTDIQKIEICGKDLYIPGYYQRVDSEPGDPEESMPFMVQSPNAMCLAFVFPTDESKSLPRNKEDLISGIRQFLTDKQGLIQVEVEPDYVYSIVKTLKEPSGVQYVLTYQRFYHEFILNIQGFFEEIGTTGIRDNTIFAMYKQQNLIGTEGDPFAGWTKDPYDDSIKNGALMNISEQERFDEKFPAFPLSLCREFIRTVVEAR